MQQKIMLMLFTLLSQNRVRAYIVRLDDSLIKCDVNFTVEGEDLIVCMELPKGEPQ